MEATAAVGISAVFVAYMTCNDVWFSINFVAALRRSR